MATEVPVPAQYQPQPVTDFRSFGHGPRGYKVAVTKKGTAGQKRKLEEYQAQVEVEAATLPPAEEAAPVGPTKRPKHNTTGLAKASKRSWKLAGERANTLKNPKLSTSWEKKMRDKAEKTAFLTQKREAQAVFKAQRAKSKAQREESRKRKEENRKASEVVVQITSATAKRMLKSKKGRTQVRTA